MTRVPSRFDFLAPARIHFGPGTLAEAAPLARSLGARAFVLTGRDPKRAQALVESLCAASVSSTLFAVSSEPTLDVVTHATALARAAGCDVVIGFGGGSALDTAKAVSGLLTNSGELLDYLEVIGRGQSLAQPAAPCIQIPTTAGTGAEVTRNAVLASPAHRLKVSLRSPHLLPRAAIVDPTLALDLPPAITAATGLDALTQVIEPYLSCRANAHTDTLCLDAIPRAAHALSTLVVTPRDLAARTDLALAALHSGLALANSGLGVVHGFASVLGGNFSAPHGALCAALLAPAVETNLAAARARQPSGETERRITTVARLLTGDPHAAADAAAPFLRALVAQLRIPPLRTYGLTRDQIPALIPLVAAASSTKANPLPLTANELTAILTNAL